MKFQGEECVLNMSSYVNRSDVALNGTFWVRQPVNESVGYRQPWLRFTHTLTAAENDRLRSWLQAVAADKPAEPLQLPNQLRRIYRIETGSTTDISLGFDYDQSPEPLWWAWDITAPLQIRMDIPRDEFAQLITVFDTTEWSFY